MKLSYNTKNSNTEHLELVSASDPSRAELFPSTVWLDQDKVGRPCKCARRVLLLCRLLHGDAKLHQGGSFRSFPGREHERRTKQERSVKSVGGSSKTWFCLQNRTFCWGGSDRLTKPHKVEYSSSALQMESFFLAGLSHWSCGNSKARPGNPVVLQLKNK